MMQNTRRILSYKYHGEWRALHVGKQVIYKIHSVLSFSLKIIFTPY